MTGDEVERHVLIPGGRVRPRFEFTLALPASAQARRSVRRHRDEGCDSARRTSRHRCPVPPTSTQLRRHQCARSARPARRSPASKSIAVAHAWRATYSAVTRAVRSYDELREAVPTFDDVIAIGVHPPFSDGQQQRAAFVLDVFERSGDNYETVVKAMKVSTRQARRQVDREKGSEVTTKRKDRRVRRVNNSWGFIVDVPTLDGGASRCVVKASRPKRTRGQHCAICSTCTTTGPPSTLRR